MLRRTTVLCSLGAVAGLGILAVITILLTGTRPWTLFVALGMLCGPAVAAVALVTVCSTVRPQTLEVRER